MWGGARGGATPSTAFDLAPFAETRTPTENFGKANGPLGLKITPLARRLIAQSGIDLSGLAEKAKAKGAWRIGKAAIVILAPLPLSPRGLRVNPELLIVRVPPAVMFAEPPLPALEPPEPPVALMSI